MHDVDSVSDLLRLGQIGRMRGAEVALPMLPMYAAYTFTIWLA